MTGTTVVLTRHGETDWNRADRMQGWAPVPLNDRGRRQARALGSCLASRYDVDRIVASDLRRTRETAALLVSAGVDAETTFERDWRERDIGAYQGFSRETLTEEFPAIWGDGIHAIRERPPGGEPMLAVHERVLSGWQNLRTAGETVVVVTHGGPLALLLGHLKEQDMLTALTEHSLDNCALTEIAVDDGVEIRRENETLTVEPAESN